MARRDHAFAAYVAQRRPQLYRAAYLLCGDPHRAEDVVQAALTKLYISWHRVERADSVDAYVRRALVNSHLDEHRRPWRREQPEPDARLDVQLDARLDGAVAGPPVEEHDALFAALRLLPAGQRRVVVLRHYWGLSVEETAADLGVSTGTIKSQTSVALASLRSLLASETAEGAT